jgi:hypothetical protein
MYMKTTNIMVIRNDNVSSIKIDIKINTKIIVYSFFYNSNSNNKKLIFILIFNIFL